MATENNTLASILADKLTDMDKKRMKYMHKADNKPRRINLSQKDELLLMRYCMANKISPNRAIKKIIHTYLSENLEPLPEQAENQLDLFAPKQMNIFDYKA